MITVEGEIEMLQYGIIPNNKTVGYVKTYLHIRRFSFVKFAFYLYFYEIMI